MEREGDVLQGFEIIVVGVDLHTSAIVSTQHHVCRYAHILGEEDVVIVIDGEVLIADDLLLLGERETNAFLFHFSHRTKTDYLSAFKVGHYYIGTDSIRHKHSKSCSAETIFRLIRVIFYVQAVSDVGLIGSDFSHEAV